MQSFLMHVLSALFTMAIQTRKILKALKYNTLIILYLDYTLQRQVRNSL